MAIFQSKSHDMHVRHTRLLPELISPYTLGPTLYTTFQFNTDGWTVLSSSIELAWLAYGPHQYGDLPIQADLRQFSRQPNQQLKNPHVGCSGNIRGKSLDLYDFKQALRMKLPGALAKKLGRHQQDGVSSIIVTNL